MNASERIPGRNAIGPLLGNRGGNRCWILTTKIGPGSRSGAVFWHVPSRFEPCGISWSVILVFR